MDDGITRGYAHVTLPDGIGDKSSTYSNVTLYDNGLFYDGKYYMNSLVLANAADNTANIAANEGVTDATVTLSGRTLYSDVWNTLCLPFNMTEEQVTSQLAPSKLKTLSSTLFEDGKLTLNFADATTIEAGKPYIIKRTSGDDITNPVFTDVTVSNTTTDNAKVETDYATFIGTLSPITLAADSRDLLYLGANSTLYYPNADITIGSCRAYFQLNGITAGDKSTEVRAFNLNFDDDATGISTINIENLTNDGGAWYDLKGRMLNGKPVQKGIYINNGRKVVFK